MGLTLFDAHWDEMVLAQLTRRYKGVLRCRLKDTVCPSMKSIRPTASAQADRVSDVIPWRSMIAPGVLLQKYRHGLQRSYAVRGPDVMGESPEVQGALMLQANEVLKRLGGRWMLQSEAQRQRVATLPAVAWPSPVLTLLDQERRRSLLDDPGAGKPAIT